MSLLIQCQTFTSHLCVDKQMGFVFQIPKLDLSDMSKNLYEYTYNPTEEII